MTRGGARKGAGRPPGTNTRNKSRWPIRWTDGEELEIELAAAREVVTPSQFIRNSTMSRIKGDTMIKFASEIRACAATFTRSTAYEGGIEYEHAVEEGSPDCTCGHGSHVVTSDGCIIPSIMDYERR